MGKEKRKRDDDGGGGKRAKNDEGAGNKPELDEIMVVKSPIASPESGKKLSKKLLKLVKKAAKSKSLKRGIKEVVKALRKDQTGICLLAHDIFPVDVIAHVPVLCEDKGIPYCYVSSKNELGAAAQTKRPTSVVVVSSKGPLHEESADDYRECFAETKKLNILC